RRFEPRGARSILALGLPRDRAPSAFLSARTERPPARKNRQGLMAFCSAQANSSCIVHARWMSISPALLPEATLTAPSRADALACTALQEFRHAIVSFGFGITGRVLPLKKIFDAAQPTSEPRMHARSNARLALSVLPP